MNDGKDAQAFLGSQPWGMPADQIIGDVVPDDSRYWVELSDGMWSRPMHINTSLGYYVHLLKINRSGIVSRHRHTGPVHAYVLKGQWHYLEHDWTAREGSYVFEPPGETHTLMVPEGCDEMLTIFTVYGALVYVDENGNSAGYDDVYTRLEKYRNHFDAVGLGADTVREFMR